MKTNRILTVENSFGERFEIGEKVAHQDKKAGVAIIKKFSMSKTHKPEIIAHTHRGIAHIDFLEKIETDAPKC